MYRVELRFEGGECRIIETDGAETIYQTAAGHGVALLTDCLEGACATCKARCIEGEFELLDPSFDALSGEEEARGYVLLCQMEARSSCVIEIPYSLDFAVGTPGRKLQARLSSLERISAQMVQLGCTVDAPLDFVPGQYARLRVPGTSLTRAYSFANPPRVLDLVFHVRLLAGGAMSRYLVERARVGDTLELCAPLGGFYLRAGAGPVVLIAGGTGLAPLLSMLTVVGRAPTRAVTLIHGVREPGELFGRGPIARGPRREVEPRVLEIVEWAEAGWPGPVGRVTDLIGPDLFTEEGTDAYLCGPPAMVTAVERRLAELGVPGQRVFLERFNPA